MPVMILSLVEGIEDVVKFKADGDKRVRTSKIRFDNNGEAFFCGFGGMKLYFSEFMRTDFYEQQATGVWGWAMV